MRVLLTTDTVGGVWTFTRELTLHLLEQGNPVALVSLGRAPSVDQARWCNTTKHQHGDDFRYEASSAPLEWMSENDSACEAAAPLLMRMADEFRAEVLHANQFCFGALPLAIPKLITAHSDVLSWAKACRPEGLEPSPWLMRYCEMVRDGLAGVEALAAPTCFMLDALAEHFELPRACHLVLNGRSLPHEDHDMQPRLLQAISAGRLWDEGKNVSILSTAEAPFPILIAGEREYEGLCFRSQPGKTLLGDLNEADFIRALQASSIYIVTSIYEPFGLAPLEAALCGCAVVTNDLPSMREIWGSAALYFDDAATLTALLHYLQNSPEALKIAQLRSGVRARQLTAARMTEQYIEIYDGLLTDVADRTEQGLSHAK